MKINTGNLYWLVISLGGLSFPSLAHAYVGPGAGLSAIGSFLALLVAVVVAIVGFLWFPIKRMLRKRKQAGATEQNPETED